MSTTEDLNLKRNIDNDNYNDDENKVLKKIKVDESSSFPPLGIQETDVGIIEFLNKENVKGFKGIMKQRYTDFLVNEIGLDGNVVHLTDTGFMDKKDRRREKRQQQREIEQKERESATQENNNDDKKKNEINVKPDLKERLIELVGEEDYNKILELFNNGNNIETSKTFDSKNSRTSLHQLLREAFGGRLESVTSPTNTIKIAIDTNTRSRRGGNNSANSSAINKKLGPKKDFLHFVLYKENKETMEAATLFSKFLRIPSKNFRYAGTKDRRGVTAQHVCIPKMNVERVNGLNRTLRGIKLGCFSYKDEDIKLGELLGNEFLITIREIEVDSNDIIKSGIESLKSKGFINYFGMQRFGTFSISTHAVGTCILSSQYEKAVNLILSKQELVAPESIEAREIWYETKDPQKAFSKIPRRCAAEFNLLKCLSQKARNKDIADFNENDYLDSIMQIPRNLRIMYGHAYQSYIWNIVTTERIRLFGLDVVPGDLVIDEQTQAATKTENVEEEDDYEEDLLKQDNFTRAKVLTEEDIKSRKYSIYDVVLPTPGFDVEYPTNEMIRKAYVDTMAADGLDPFNMARNIREFSLSGSYRNIVSKPKNVEYWIRKYEDPVEQMVKTDLQIIQEEQDLENSITEKEEGENVGENETVKPTFDTIERIKKDEGTGSKVALILKMQLGVSTYATMALRELMRTDTSRRGDGLDVKLSITACK